MHFVYMVEEKPCIPIKLSDADMCIALYRFLFRRNRLFIAFLPLLGLQGQGIIASWVFYRYEVIVNIMA